MANRLFSLGLASLLLLSLLIACATATSPTVTTVPRGPSTSKATAQPSLTAAPSPTPKNPYADLPIISPANAGNVREIKRLSKGTIKRALWTPDSKRLMVGTSNGIYIYDIATHEELEFFNTRGPADCMTISPDGRWLAWCDGALTRLEDLADHNEYSVAEGGGEVKTIVFSPDRQTLAVEKIIQRSDGESRPEIDETDVYRLSDREFLVTIRSGSKPVFSADGQFLAVSVDDRVKFVNMATSRYEYSVGASWEVVFSPDGRFLATSPKEDSGDNTVELRDMRTRELICKFSTDTSPNLTFSPDGAQLAFSNPLESAEIRDTSTCQLHIAIPDQNGYVPIAYSPDGKTLATLGRANRTLTLLNAATGETVRKFGGFYGDWEGFSPDGKLILESRWHDGTAAVWSVSEGMPIWTLEEHTPGASRVAFSPDGRLLASGHSYGQVHLWSLETGQIQGSFGGFTFVEDVAFSPDGQMIAAGGMIDSAYDEDSHIEIKNLGRLSGEPVFSWTGNNTEKTWITKIGFSPDGRYFGAASVWDGARRIWDLGTRQLQIVFVVPKSPYYFPIAFSSDSQAIAISDAEGFVSFWDIHSTRRLRDVVADPEENTERTASSRVPLLAFGDSKGGVSIWDTYSRGYLGAIENVSTLISSLSISPDGSVLAVSEQGSEQDRNLITLWDIKNHQRQAIIPTGWALRVAFSPDGRLLASAGDDGVVRLWGVR